MSEHERIVRTNLDAQMAAVAAAARACDVDLLLHDCFVLQRREAIVHANRLRSRSRSVGRLPRTSVAALAIESGLYLYGDGRMHGRNISRVSTRSAADADDRRSTVACPAGARSLCCAPRRIGACVGEGM